MKHPNMLDSERGEVVARLRESPRGEGGSAQLTLLLVGVSEDACVRGLNQGF